MPLPEPSEQEGESVKAGQEPSPESPEPGTDVVPAAPRKPRKFSKLVLLTASKDSAKVAGAKRKGVHCIMSLGVPGPATLAKALLKIHPEAQRAIEAAPQEPEQKRSKLDTDLSTALPTSCPILGQAAGREQQLPDAQPRFGPKFPGNSLCVPGPVAFGSMSLESAIPAPALAAGTPRFAPHPFPLFL
ncbi:FLYWCH family member 2 isoform X1 [Delphinus delphis]|uniref:FLYWCH family member 2 isoform X1 n=1 Tax=Tursiops truncatus TaxID=9739 RepID=A0A6J3Q0U4_TURTR|nr:FLYWCH family member 2 isoform X1 [Tursiops truncatus]XP_033695936.1 FLYWCH family member 2 isoform X1 [Tursiops truncatus]XP_033695937.1 FLYWCH family member 2 isoform X1 [Tursiops truncatus]XP_033695938.1 FLYWCH family member 2 isoform X1 [Tursiops truncatus]XP_059888984.1 FLYWCH family member 2 isoform X1 [Delphinus delphis]